MWIVLLKCPPASEDEILVKFLEQIALDRNLNGWVLFPSTDEQVRIFAQNWERLSKHYRVTTPPWTTIRFLYDKWLTYQLAKERNVPVPGTCNPKSENDLKWLDLEFPVVLKPIISKRFMSVTKKKAFRANNQEELIHFYKVMAAAIDPSEILVQELIPGRTKNLYSYVGFFKDGRPVAGLSAKRLRQHPMEFGRASTYVEMADIPELGILATQLLEGIAYTGLAEVEFMYDEKDARFELLEVNPRIWGWHTIAVKAGLDLPYFAYADAVGNEFRVGRMRKDVKWVQLVTDVPTALLEMLARRLSVRQYLASLSGDITDAVFSLDDPLPFIADLLLAPYNYIGSRGF